MANDTEPSAEALELYRELYADIWAAIVGNKPWDKEKQHGGALILDRFRAAGVEAAYKHCLQLADDMTNQRALIRDLMKLAGVEKFKRTAKCLICMKNPRAEDGGMLCQPCRDKADDHPNMARWIAEGP